MGVGKPIMGLILLSFFTCVSAFYTFVMVLAKSCAIAGIYKSESQREQCRYHMLAGAVLSAVSVLYIAYSARLLFYPTTSIYHPYVAIGIAAVTFAEIAINIRGVIVEQRNRTMLIHAVKMINLASSLICLVLTQMALLSFTDTNIIITKSHANATMGILMSSVAAILGIAMIIRSMTIIW